MRSDFKKIGDHIRLVDERNAGLKVKNLLGLSISKQFIPSVANIIGTDMENYKIIRRKQFACSTMQVRRDKKMPIALLQEVDEAIISQAYPVFEVIDTEVLLPEYLMMWFSRQEFDREACFYAVGGVRGSLEWEDFCEMQLPIPHPDKQKEIVKEYNTIVNRINLNNQLIQKLEETAQAIYKQWFVDFEFPVTSPPMEGCPQDGVVKRNSRNYFDLPYNPALKDRAKALRKAGNLAEVLFWRQVRNKSFKGLDFDRQKIIGNYIVDFYCPNNQVVIEIDGSSHDNKQEYDAARDDYLKSLGLEMIHITDTDVKNNIDSVMRFLEEHPVFNRGKDHPAFQAPLHRRGIGYRSSGGEMVWNEELGKDIPIGWKILPISDIGDIKAGGDKPNVFSEIKTTKCQVPIYSNGITNDGLYGYTNKYNYPQNSITISARGTIGFSVLRREDFDAIVRLVVLIPKHLYSAVYLWQTIKKIEFDDSGSVQNQLTIPQVSVISILFPEQEVLKRYDSISNLIYMNIELNTKENQKLSDLKELLLSKLATIEN